MQQDPPDLRQALAKTLTLLQAEGEPQSAAEALQRLGVVLGPTLQTADPASPDASADDPLLSLGRFQLRGELGRGGMGRVLEARDPDLRRSVAVKVLIDPSQVTEAQLGRFVAEAQITSQLEHPNIVPVYEMGVTPQGEIFFVMKKVGGRSLRQLLARLSTGDAATAAKWTRHRLLTSFVQVCNAVAYAHDRAVLHRDLKPDNVMLGSFGEVLLMDWGLARLIGATDPEARSRAVERVNLTQTMDGATIGTPGFMSPEQAEGDLAALDGRSDVWSLGAILYELLTLQPAYVGENMFVVMLAAAEGPPPDPRERSPDRRIPAAIAEICLQALASDPTERFQSASQLARAVEDFLEGTKRREAALQFVDQAGAAWDRYGLLAAERRELSAREALQACAVEDWSSLGEKAELRATRRRLGEIAPERTRRFTEVLSLCDKALSHDPNNDEARVLLAEAHFARFEEAEHARDEQQRLYHESRVREYDDGRHAAALQGTGSLTLRTDPPGVEVVCERFETSADLAWPLVERRILGVTPLEDVALDQGSYLLTLSATGRRSVRYPVHIPRGRTWHSGELPVPLYGEADIGHGFVYVPTGPSLSGGDDQAGSTLAQRESTVPGFFVAETQVTTAQYCEFLTELAREDEEEAWSRVPRVESGLKRSGGQYWERPPTGQAYRVPEADRDGDRWDPDWPVNSISWYDACAYIAWRSKRDGLDWRLPAEREWEKAARGADGRLFPWGNGFDPALCKMRTSRAGSPQPEPVAAFRADVSPYGVRDLAGGMRDWCGDPDYDGDPDRHPVRGGSWFSPERLCRAAYRDGNAAWLVIANVGFRLARDAEPGSTVDDLG